MRLPAILQRKRPKPLAKPAQHTKPLGAFQDPDEIRVRLVALRRKALNIDRYNDSVRDGAPDVGLLDEKQQQLLAYYREAGQLFPARIFRDLRATIDTLQSRLLHKERLAA